MCAHKSRHKSVFLSHNRSDDARQFSLETIIVWAWHLPAAFSSASNQTNNKQKHFPSTENRKQGNFFSSNVNDNEYKEMFGFYCFERRMAGEHKSVT